MYSWLTHRDSDRHHRLLQLSRCWPCRHAMYICMLSQAISINSRPNFPKFIPRVNSVDKNCVNKNLKNKKENENTLNKIKENNKSPIPLIKKIIINTMKKDTIYFDKNASGVQII